MNFKNVMIENINFTLQFTLNAISRIQDFAYTAQTDGTFLLNPFPNYKFLDSSKTERICRRQF